MAKNRGMRKNRKGPQLKTTFVRAERNDTEYKKKKSPFLIGSR